METFILDFDEKWCDVDILYEDLHGELIGTSARYPQSIADKFTPDMAMIVVKDDGSTEVIGLIHNVEVTPL